MKRKISYFFSESGWMANLGVVPLLRSWALRFLPIFLSLLARRFRVTRVRETITVLLNHYFSARLKTSFLAFFTLNVKRQCLFSSTLFFAALLHSPASAESKKTYFLSQGEHVEISAESLKNYSVTDSQVISHKHLEDKEKLLLKGKSPGHSELILWKSSEKSVSKFHVFENNPKKPLLQLAKTLKRLGFETKIFESFLAVKGQINDFSQYRLLHQLKERYPKKLKLHIDLNKKLTQDLIARAYSRFFDLYIDNVSCWSESGTLFCEYPQSQNLTQADRRYLSQQLHVQLMPTARSAKSDENLKLKLKIVQEEKMNGRQLSLGLDRLEISPKDLFTQGLTDLVESNRLILKEHDLHISTLAEPESLVKEGETTVLRVGSEIPYVSTTQEGAQNTQWKFAGLKVSLTPIAQKNRLKIRYKTQFTYPGINSQEAQGASVSGSHEESTLYVKKGEPLRLFQILFQAFGRSQKQLPYLGDIPLLGRIFQGHQKQRTYKRIRGYLSIKGEHE